MIILLYKPRDVIDRCWNFQIVLQHRKETLIERTACLMENLREIVEAKETNKVLSN
jgi:hypothetical protein